MLKIAKVKSEKEFYKKYPTEEAFMKAHGKELKKAAMGKAMVYDQLHQLTDFGNPPIAQYGGAVNPNTGMFNMPMSGQSVSRVDTMAAGYGSAAPPEGFGNVEGGGGADAAGIAGAAIGALPGIISGVQAMEAQTQSINKAYQARELSELNLQANSTREKVKRKYVRPEDMILQPGQMGNPSGSGTNFLSKNGRMIGGNPTEIQNMYNPGDMYTDLGFEPMGETLKQFKKGGNLPEAEFGDYFQSSGQAQIGSAAGTAIGSLVGGPLGGMVGGLIGTAAGNLLGGARDARELQREKGKAEMNTQQAAFQQAQQNQFGAYMEQGGKVDVGDEYKWVSHTWQPQTIAKFGEYNVKDLLKPPTDADMLRSGGHLKDEYYTPPSAEAMFTGRPELKPLTMEQGGQMAMGGDLKILEGGKAETISYNPFLPDGGETVMFKGRSHDNGGIPINFGENGVEVEGGEPAVKLENGGEESNMVVFGNMKINKNIADLMGDPKAKGSKFKHYVADIAKNDAKQLKRIDKATDIINNANNNSAAGQLELITAKLIKQGAEAYQKINADRIQEAGIVQNAILDTASQLGVKSDKLAEGKLEKEYDPRMMAKFGAKMETAQNGVLSKKPFDPLRGRRLSTVISDKTKFSNPELTSNLMYPGASRISPGGDQALGDALTFGDPYNQSATSTSLSQYNPITETANTILSQTPTSDKRGVKNNKSKGVTKSSKMPTNRGPLDTSIINLYNPVTLPEAPQSLNRGTLPLNLQDTVSASEDSSLSFGQRALGSLKSLGKGLEKGIDKYGPTVLSNVAPWLRPSNANEALPPDQLYPEYFALATNQLDPVQAQTFQPMLDTPMDISLNDQLNAIDSQSRAAIRAAGQNPSAQAMIMAQTLEAKNKVLGEQTRINAANKIQTYDKNRALLNDAKLKNLQILDNQYVRQAQARSNTKEQTFNALSSIAAKTAQQRAANRNLAVMENMYNFRFTPGGRAINTNAPAQFNVPGASGSQKTTDAKGNDLLPIYNKKGDITGYKVKEARHGSLVKALKNL